MKVKVTDYIVQVIHDLGVDCVFGYQGGNISHLIDSIYREPGIKFIETYHEQAAAFAANSYAQVNDCVGVAVASSGPGAINLLNGVANAFCDSIPCLFFTGDVNTTAKKQNASKRQNAFQEIDIVEMAKPITKYSVTINSERDVSRELEKGIRIACNGRKGPVLFNLPHDIQRSYLEIIEESGESCVSTRQETFDDEEFKKSVKILEEASFPVIVVGGGMKNSLSKGLLLDFLEHYKAPVVSSLLGLDVLFHNHPNFIGMIGSYGNLCANMCLKYADCILALGTRLDDRQISPSDAQYFENKNIIHVDIDENELKNKVREDVSLNCDIKEFLKKACAFQIVSNINDDWLSAVKKLAKKYSDTKQNTQKIDAGWFLKKLSLAVKDMRTAFTFDVGNNQMICGQSIFIGNECYSFASGGLGSMGYSLPAAIGVSQSSKVDKVICISGDGGIQMNLQELNTVDYHKLGVNVVVFNNNGLGMIYDLQTKLFPGRFCATVEGYKAPCFKKIAEAFNFSYKLVQTVEDYDNAINSLKSRERVFVEVVLDISDKTNPDPGKGMFEQMPPMDKKDIDLLERLISE